MNNTLLSPNSDFEMSRSISVEDIKQRQEIEKKFEASEQEKQDLAQRLGVIALKSFSGTVQIKFIKQDHSFQITGRFNAEVTQECQRNFTPVNQKISESFSEKLVTDSDQLIPVDELLETDEAVELLQSDNIDYGEIVTQWLSLSLNPYPRSDDEVFEHIEYKGEETNPFAILKTVKLENNTKK